MKKIVDFHQWIKRNTPFKHTWHIEVLFVLPLLMIPAIVINKGWVEWIGVAAVFFSFMHASVAERLAEAEKIRSTIYNAPDHPIAVHCYSKLEKYFYTKEVCWCLYFFILGAWSALIGVFIFLIYPSWRKIYRKYCD